MLTCLHAGGLNVAPVSTCRPLTDNDGVSVNANVNVNVSVSVSDSVGVVSTYKF